MTTAIPLHSFFEAKDLSSGGRRYCHGLVSNNSAENQEESQTNNKPRLQSRKISLQWLSTASFSSDFCSRVRNLVFSDCLIALFILLSLFGAGASARHASKQASRQKKGKWENLNRPRELDDENDDVFRLSDRRKHSYLRIGKYLYAICYLGLPVFVLRLTNDSPAVERHRRQILICHWLHARHYSAVHSALAAFLDF